MLEFLKDYKSFRESIREVKIEQFTELKNLLDENEKLKREAADREAAHERTVMSLTHQLTLERERFALEMKTREAAQAKELLQERGEFLEKNFADAERMADKRQATIIEVLNAVVTRISDRRLDIGGDEGKNVQKRLTVEEPKSD